MEFVYKYFRDDVELSSREWFELLAMDISAENKNSLWNVGPRVNHDLAYDNEAWVNDHFYNKVEETHFETAKELVNEMIDYDDCELLEAIQQFSERECQMILKYIPRARIEAEYFVLEEKEYE